MTTISMINDRLINQKNTLNHFFFSLIQQIFQSTRSESLGDRQLEPYRKRSHNNSSIETTATIIINNREIETVEKSNDASIGSHSYSKSTTTTTTTGCGKRTTDIN